MELWIRSQDKKTLGKFNDISIRRFIDEDTLYSYQVVGYFDKDTEFEVLGEYRSFARSLEVLDEIQNILAPKYMIRMDSNINKVADFLNIEGAYIKNDNNADIKNINDTFVYEMPQE